LLIFIISDDLSTVSNFNDNSGAIKISPNEVVNFTFALDDFGTGFSSLTHIRDYPIDCLKVDCSFIQKMQNDPSIYSIVQAIGLLAPNLSLGLIAEGIETPEQEELLLQFGYNIGQGFLFEQAIDANQVVSILKQGQAYLESHYSMS